MKKKEKNIFNFFIKMLLLFIGLDIVMVVTSNILASTSLLAKYGVELINEIFYAMAVLIVMLLFHNSYVFTEKKNKFWNSVYLGMPMLIISLINFILNFSSFKTISIANFINVFVLCAFVGIAEEFLCRGWLQNEFIERFSKDKKSVVTSILCASLIFGVMHIVNLSSQTFFETMLQIVNATAIGMLLGSIYYKTKNIWSVIFLHSFYDFTIFLGEMNLVKNCTYNTPTLGVTIVNCLGIIFISALWIFSALKVLNSISYNGEKTNKRKDCMFTSLMIVSFVLVLLPIEGLVPKYEEYKTCYEYIQIDNFKDYEEHFPHYDNYYIESNIETSRFEDGLNLPLKEITIEEDVIISIKMAEKNTVNIKNENTTYEVKLGIDEAYRLELLENDSNYILIIESLNNEATIYYNKINKYDLKNSRDFIDYIASSFTKYYLPDLDKVGYVTIGNNNEKYPYFVSSNNDRFIIKNGNLFLIK